EQSAIKAITELRMLDDHNLENRDIELRIHSTGGSVTAAFAIYDAIQNLKSDVRTVCEGTAQSMGSFLLTTGTPGKREAL
ncbi:ATP-dependent Clp protease proteolytic subunit, partial [Enterococcus hirae]